MKNSAVRHLKPDTGFKYNNNKHIIVALTVEKLSGCGVSCSKSAVHLLQTFAQKMDCIFVAENKSIANLKTLTI